MVLSVDLPTPGASAGTWATTLNTAVQAIVDAVNAEPTNRDAAISAAVAALIDSAPDTLNTLNEIAAALGDDANLAADLAAQIATKANSTDLTTETTNRETGDANTLTSAKAYTDQETAPLAPTESPALTGTPTAPTAAPGTNSTQIATTGFTAAAVAAQAAADSAAYVPLDGDTAATVRDNYTTVAQRLRGISTSSGISPQRFSAPTDGTDATEQMQAWADFCSSEGYRALMDADETYSLSDTLLVDSGCEFGGQGRTSVLQATVAGKPVVASKNWKVGAGGSLTGRSHWHHFTVDGGGFTDPAGYGFIFRGYYADLHDIETRNCGGPGSSLLAYDSGGTIYSGSSLVDGRIRNLDVANCGLGGTASMFLGEQSNNKFTDWYLADIYINNAAAATSGLYCGSAPGWKMRRIHSYGSPNGPAMQILNASQFDGDDLYLEHWVGAALYFGSIQRGNNVGRITARGMNAAGYIVQVASLAASVTSGSLNIDTIAVTQDINQSVTAMRNDISTCAVNLGKVSRDGNYASQIIKVSGFGAPQVTYLADAKSDGTVRDSANAKTLTYAPPGGGTAAPMALSKWVEWSGNAAQTIDVLLPDIRNFDTLGVTLTVGSKSNYTGAARTSWQGLVLVGTKTNGTDAWGVNTVQILAPTGFTVAPTVTVTNTSGNSGKLTVSFTATNTDEQGFVSALVAYE